MAFGQSGNSSGVNTSREERADGNVCAHVLSHAVFQSFGDAVVKLLLVFDFLSPELRLEVAVGYNLAARGQDRKSTRLNSSHVAISYAVFCLKKKKNKTDTTTLR